MCAKITKSCCAEFHRTSPAGSGDTEEGAMDFRLCGREHVRACPRRHSWEGCFTAAPLLEHPGEGLFTAGHL